MHTSKIPQGDTLDLPKDVYAVDELVHHPKVKDWCALPYPGHPKGCPNYGKKDKCPPRCCYITDYFHLDRPMYLVHSEFSLTNHMKRMKRKHPEWSERQLRNVYYWQSTSRKQLLERVNDIIGLLRCNAVTRMPEAMGVNVYVTAKKAGLILEPIKSLKTCRHVALIGRKKF